MLFHPFKLLHSSQEGEQSTSLIFSWWLFLNDQIHSLIVSIFISFFYFLSNILPENHFIFIYYFAYMVHDDVYYGCFDLGKNIGS